MLQATPSAEAQLGLSEPKPIRRFRNPVGVIPSLSRDKLPNTGVARVGPVYTPPAYRRRRYGGAVTEKATAVGLSAGAERVVRSTDLAKPTSNFVYQSIGYLPNHDAEEREPSANPALRHYEWKTPFGSA